MPDSTNYSEAIQFLYDLRLFGARLGLDKTRRLAELAGDPQKKLKFIHVAGTNGKGSTCAMLESVYRASGRKTGLFTSPHLVSFAERIQVNRRWISHDDVVRLVEKVRGMFHAFAADERPTFFEAVTVMALVYFAEQECDIVIWETGLGGRLDATNIVRPLASVITNVQFDHQKWLGFTRADIAVEKAGIIKEGVPVITAEPDHEIVQIFRRIALEKRAPLHVIRPETAPAPLFERIRLPLLGEHQLINAALAFAVVQRLQEVLPVDEPAIVEGLNALDWPGRMQVVHRGPGRVLVLDGAHNPAGARALKEALERYFPGTLATLIFGVLEEKDWMNMCQVLVPLAGRVWLTSVASDRTAEPGRLRAPCQQINPYAEVLLAPDVKTALDGSDHDPLVVVTGSLHFVGEALEAIGLAPSPQREERRLNDWTAPAAGTPKGSPAV